MKALILKSYHHFEYCEVPVPEFAPDEVLIQVKACGICGSDVHGMDGSSGRRIPPIIMGHEAAGLIVEVGAKVKNWQKGDRVTFDSTIYPLEDWFTRKGLYNLSDNRTVLGVSCEDYRRHGAFAEFVVVPQHILYRIPDGVTFEQAAMVEPVAVAMHALQLAQISFGDVAVVVGAGMVGLFIIQLLKWSGCSRIIAVDLLQQRLDLAAKLGADIVLKSDECDVVDEVFKVSENRCADVAFEVVGITATVGFAIESLRKGGSVVLVGNLSQKAEIPLQAVVTRQLKLQGSCAICGEYPAALDMIANGKVDVNAIISATAPLSEGAVWFKRLYDKEPGLMKVILKP